MSQEIVKFDVNNGISLEYSCDVKEEFQDEYYPDNKVCFFETAVTDIINIDNTEMNSMKHDIIEKYETLTIDLIKTDVLLSEVDDTVINNVKREDGICPADIQIKFYNELLFCNHCHEVYEDYCNKCRVVVHILNENPSHNTYDRARELPKYILETRESFGQLGIFTLKAIPENVRFGPFTGLSSIGLPLRIKGGRFAISEDKLEHLNWMQFINPARNISEQNLFPFQYEDKLYYCSTRRIQEEEELLVYFGEEYEDNLLKDVEMDFVPITKKDIGYVFACIFCCLGFSSKEYLAEHKAVCHSESNEMFSVEELAKCPFCKIYLEAKEYFEHHKDYCCETNARQCILPTSEVYEVEAERRSSLRNKAKRCKRRIYKCTQCKFRTMYNADFRHHANQHYRVKIHKCGICPRKYTAKKSLEVHVITKHLGERNYKCAECEYNTNRKSYLEKHIKTKHLKENEYECRECEYKTNYKTELKKHIKGKHLKQYDYRCAECEFKTNYKSKLKGHIKAKHLKQKDYKCAECEFMTYYKSSLENHIKGRHLNHNNYKCAECEFKTNYKSHLNSHIKVIHLKQNLYNCTECEYKTNNTLRFKQHINAKHLKDNDYNCAECEFKTYHKSSLKEHINAKHLKGNDYNCAECEYRTNRKSYLERHINGKHLKENSYKCIECEFKTYYKSSLKEHIKAKHLKGNDYICAECKFKTNIKSHLKKHIKTKHLKENCYKCTKCEFKTYYKSHITEHTFKHDL